MKQLVKSLLVSAFGDDQATAIIRRVRGIPETFSEAELIAAWFRVHPRKGVMVDVGAHFGESLAPYLKLGWEIHAFEPDPANRAKLKENIDVSKIHLHDCAVSDHEEDGVAFFASPESDGISSLSAFRETHKEVNRVRLTTLDAMLPASVVRRVDFLKIDTEGHDLFVLRGFPWARLQPDVVLCEFEDSKTIPLGYDYKAMGDFLLSKGYQVFLSEWEPIVRYGIQHNWSHFVSYPAKLNNAQGWGNFVAFKAGMSLAALKKYLARFQN